MGNTLSKPNVEFRKVGKDDDVSVYSLGEAKLGEIYSDYISLTREVLSIDFDETEEKVPKPLQGRIVLPKSNDIYGKLWIVGVKDLMMHKQQDYVMDSYNFVSEDIASISFKPKDSSINKMISVQDNNEQQQQQIPIDANKNNAAKHKILPAPKSNEEKDQK